MTRPRSTLILCGLMAVLLALPVLGGCMARPKGFYGNTMSTGNPSNLLVTPNSPLELMGQGTVLASVKSDSSSPASSRTFYAVYGEKGVKDVTRHGHVIVSTFESIDSTYEFLPESNIRYFESELGDTVINGQGWKEHQLYVEAEKDWFSALWQANGHTTPEMWIGKRWSRTYFSTTRVVVEYREPMPECVDIAASQGYSRFAIFKAYDGECARQIKDFDARAAEAFSIQSARAEEAVAAVQNEAEVPLSLTIMPESRLTQSDMTNLVGTARRASALDKLGNNP